MMAAAPISDGLAAHREAVNGFFDRHGVDIEALARRIADGYRTDPPRQVLVFGNGGSACDAMHIAGEFVGRFQKERRALPALALSADTGMITAIGNDYGFERIFARQVEAYGRSEDVCIALSTSGGSANVLQALDAARNQGLFTVLMTGEKGASRSDVCDVLLAVPSATTARIQETHMLALHLLAERVETMLLA